MPSVAVLNAGCGGEGALKVSGTAVDPCLPFGEAIISFLGDGVVL